MKRIKVFSKPISLMLYCSAITLNTSGGMAKTVEGAKITTNSCMIKYNSTRRYRSALMKWPTGNNFEKQSLSVVKEAEKVAIKYGTKGDIITLKAID